MLFTQSSEETGRQPSQVLNPAPELASFPLFPNLPSEIRCMIWQNAMTYERIINVELFDSYHLQSPPQNRQQTSTGNATPFGPSLGRYTATVLNGGGMSALFHTTSESRREAKEFYRVRLHSVSFRRDKTMVNGTLYLCPELDTININIIVGSLKGFDEFASDVWKKDPKKIGLVSIGISADLTMQSALRIIHSRPGRHQAFKECIERLERIIFVREITCYPSGIVSAFPGTGGELNRSVPIAGKSGGVDCLEADPRPIMNDLKRVYLGPGDPRIAVRAWSYLLMKLGIKNDSLSRNSSFKLCYGETRLFNHLTRAQIANNNRRGVHEWMGEDLAYSKKRRRVWEIAEESREAPQLAIGFWLFPLESIGPLYEKTKRKGERIRPDADSPTPVKPEFDRVEDMTKYPPKLYLCHLPTK